MSEFKVGDELGLFCRGVQIDAKIRRVVTRVGGGNDVTYRVFCPTGSYERELIEVLRDGYEVRAVPAPKAPKPVLVNEALRGFAFTWGAEAKPLPPNMTRLEKARRELREAYYQPLSGESIAKIVDEVVAAAKEEAFNEVQQQLPWDEEDQRLAGAL